MRPAIWAILAGGAVLMVMEACGQQAPLQPTEVPPTSPVQGATPAGTAEGHFNPTEAVGGGANSSAAIKDVASVFASVSEAAQLRMSANANPPGATGPDVQSVSIVAQDTGGLLKGLDAPGKQRLGETLLTAASAAWPNATISLLVTAPTGTSGTIIGTRPKGGPNSVIAS